MGFALRLVPLEWRDEPQRCRRAPESRIFLNTGRLHVRRPHLFIFSLAPADCLVIGYGIQRSSSTCYREVINICAGYDSSYVSVNELGFQKMSGRVAVIARSLLPHA